MRAPVGRRYALIHEPSRIIVAHVTRADGFWDKGWGVIGWRTLTPYEGLWLPQVASIHTVGVRCPLDVLFLDAQFATLAACPGVPPGRLLVRARGAHHTIELGAGTLTGLPLHPGDRWALSPV